MNWQFRRMIKVAILASLVAAPAGAQNLATEFSHGPTLPFYTLAWDKDNNVYSDFLLAGAGYTFNWNFLPTPSGSVRQLTLGLPVFFNVAGNGDAPAATRLYAGATVGTFNNFLSAGVALRLMDSAYDRAPEGLFISGFEKENLVLLLSFNMNIGTGKPTSIKTNSTFFSQPKDLGNPPNYVKLW